MVDPGWGFSVTADTPGFSLQANANTAMHFIEYAPAETNEQSRARQRLAEARASLDAPQSITLDGRTRSVMAGAFFAMPYLTRAHVPSLTNDDEIVLGSFADPTMAGILPDMSQAAWRDEFLGEWPVVQTNAFALAASRYAHRALGLCQK